MKKLFLGAAVALGAGAFFGAGPAAATTTCSYSAANHTVTVQMTVNGEIVIVNRGAGGAGIYVNGSPCGAADISNTNSISIIGAAGSQTAMIDMGNGAFAPGFSVDEIAFAVKLGKGRDQLNLSGTSGADDFRLGSVGADLNGDGDLDLTLGSVEGISLAGGLGDDKLSVAGGGAAGSPWPDAVGVEGGPGNDTATGGDGNDGIGGGDGNDSIVGGPGEDSIFGGFGADNIQAGSDNDSVSGERGNDTIDGGAGNDQFNATDSDDNDVYLGGTGTRDAIDYSTRGAGGVNISLDGVANDGRPGAEFDNVGADVEIVYGSPGPDTIVGSAADNTLNGNAGADTISGGFGDDTLDGGYQDNAADVLNGGGDNDALIGYGGGDTLNAGAGYDQIQPGPGNDTVNGSTGNDSIFAESSADGIDDEAGGAGYDSIFYNTRTTNLSITLDGNANDGEAGEGDNVHGDIEQVLSGSGADTITGSAADNYLGGGPGVDQIDAGDGSDTIYGGTGGDQITGGDGPDYLYGQDDDDTFHALDGSQDFIDGGTGTDTVADADLGLDTQVNIP